MHSIGKHPLTVVILCKDEEINLPICLKNIPANYPIIILDSGSKDRTIEIAENFGCKVFFKSWGGFAEQRNFALQHCGIQNGWVLFVDADEVYPPHFYTWWQSEPDLLKHIDVLMVPSYLFFCGKRLNFAPGYPIFHPRLVRHGIVPFTIGHSGHSETLMRDVRVGYGDIPYDHHFFNGDISAWMNKHIKLAEMEALAMPTNGAVTSRSRLNILMRKNFLRMPARFAYHFFLKSGFRDGWRGYLYSLMYAWYELTIYLNHKFR